VDAQADTSDAQKDVAVASSQARDNAASTHSTGAVDDVSGQVANFMMQAAAV
jgi:hypothetical protein